jgi:tRNA(Ile)-lysidine synthase
VSAIDVAAAEERVRVFVRARVPALRRDARALVAVSGGGDSIAMAALLCETRLVDAKRCTVAHFDHRLRGRAAASRDRAVVDALCERYGLALVCGAWDAPRPNEAAARGARLAFLARSAFDARCDAVAVGHTEDDHVETVVLNGMRGSGPYGQAGLAAQRAWPGPERDALTLVRPLLSLRRAETRAYCAARGLAFADDESNDDERFARNRVRAMLAGVEAETPEARGVILRQAELARDSIAALEQAAARGAPRRRVDGGSAVALPRAGIRRLGEIAGYAWRPAIVDLLGDAREFGRAHYRLMTEAAGARTGSTFPLPRGVLLTVDADELVLSLGELTLPAVPPDAAHPAACGPLALGAWEVEVRARGDAAGGAAEGWSSADVAAPEGAVLRAARPGDRVALAGGHKKLADAYIDAKVPRRERAAAPVLAAGGDVLWTPLLEPARLRPGDGGMVWSVRWRAGRQSGSDQDERPIAHG